MFMSAGKIARGGSRFSPTTWNPSDKSALIALSGGNLVATNTHKGATALVRSVASKATGKFYIEFVSTSDGAHTLGIANSTQSLSTDVGHDGNNSVGYEMSTGKVFQSGSILLTIASSAQGNNIGMAFDIASHLIWFRVNGGNWNNNASYDPATATGGISFTSLGTTYACIDVIDNVTTGIVTTNFGAAAFTYGVPSGFTAGFGA